MINSPNNIINGIKIPSLIFNNKIRDERNHHKANAPLSHINILAGLILYRRKETNTAITTTIKEVAI